MAPLILLKTCMSNKPNSYQDFRGLYDEVTVGLNAFIVRAAFRREADDFDRNWFKRVVAGFEAEFRAWPSQRN